MRRRVFLIQWTLNACFRCHFRSLGVEFNWTKCQTRRTIPVDNSFVPLAVDCLLDNFRSYDFICQGVKTINLKINLLKECKRRRFVFFCASHSSNSNNIWPDLRLHRKSSPRWLWTLCWPILQNHNSTVCTDHRIWSFSMGLFGNDSIRWSSAPVDKLDKFCRFRDLIVSWKRVKSSSMSVTSSSKVSGRSFFRKTLRNEQK